MKTPFLQRLYLRIWLAVVGAVVLMMLLVAWLWRIEAERERAMRPGREIVLRDAGGAIIGQAPARPIRTPGQAPEFEVVMRNGQTLYIQLPRPREPGDKGPRRAGPPSARMNFAWMLALIAAAVALGSYPVVRRLTQRLEVVESGVRQWGEGALGHRLPEDGQDEVANLARGFNEAAGRVQALLQSHKALLANASHELRSPLTRIRMGLELMDAQTSADVRAEIARNIQELDLLIDEILLASRLDASQADIGTMEPLDLVGIAAEECARVGAELQVEADAHALTVTGVAKLLRRLVRNLLENANRHAAGEVMLRLSAGNGTVLLSVSDHGPGVPEPYRERIFEPFFRLPGASERDGGVGLGLALVKSIVQRHGGTVRCTAGPHGGACFEVRLPQNPANGS
ncbi:HAMP domain-containing sensor histidine kinase [Comamonadaceae bacterium G21597-S1]|nr:HAMP domain-containing sensor histidine kinase [Comamonadaceae bacterium G21597-S1]